MNAQLVEAARICPAFVPKDTNGAIQTGAWVGMKFHKRLAIILKTGSWAGGTAAVTLLQAQDVSGTGSKALAFATYWLSTTTADIPVKTAVVANTFNLSAANKLVTIEITSFDLDLANSFAYVAVVVASPGANADLVDGTYCLYDASYDGLASTLPSVFL